MTVWAIIPVKPLKRAKSRLAGVLSPEERAALAETLLRRVLEVVREVPKITGTLVISRDMQALAIARDYGARTVQEAGQPELNSALMRATQVLIQWQARGAFILPADLPFVEAQDLNAMLELGMLNLSAVIATDRNEDGTNALLVRPPGLFPYSYGPGSFRRHIAAAEEAGATVKVYRSDRMMLDIDLPEDLELYRRMTQPNNLKTFSQNGAAQSADEAAT